MKKLQNDFTTPEQSKRLLELGVPSDSADCEYICENDKQVYVLNMTFSELKAQLGNNNILPCWSAGRLIEIFELCSGVLWQDTAQPSVKQPTLTERVIDTIVLFNKHGNMNFSKLEE